MICVKCGAAVPDLPFCGACGWKQEKAPPARHRRGNGQGSVFKLPSGKYKAVVTLGYALDDQGRAWFKKIEDNDPEAMEIFRWFKEVTLKEVAHMLHDACGCKQPLFYVPIALAYRLAASMEKKAAKTGEKPLMTKFAVYNLDRNNSFDYSKAERELGYHTRPYAETLRDEAIWLVKEGKIKGENDVIALA
mgnify:CR=1 FL=1